MRQDIGVFTPMLKRFAATYQPGVRSAGWRKQAGQRQFEYVARICARASSVSSTRLHQQPANESSQANGSPQASHVLARVTIGPLRPHASANAISAHVTQPASLSPGFGVSQVPPNPNGPGRSSTQTQNLP